MAHPRGLDTTDMDSVRTDEDVVTLTDEEVSTTTSGDTSRSTR